MQILQRLDVDVPEFVLQLMLQRQQRHEADMQELQRLRRRVAELEHRVGG
jgi:hypothetical protein